MNVESKEVGSAAGVRAHRGDPVVNCGACLWTRCLWTSRTRLQTRPRQSHFDGGEVLEARVERQLVEISGTVHHGMPFLSTDN